MLDAQITARWKELSPLLDTVLDLPAHERTDWITDRVVDLELRGLLQQLLGVHAHAGLLDRPPPTWDDAAAPQARPLLGRRLGPYVLQGLLGEGGMASVFLADRCDGGFQQRVAVKLLRFGLYDAYERERFLRERQILAQLKHPHIASLIDGGLTEEGVPWFALEYVDGRPITAWCDQHKPDTTSRLRLFLDICNAVDYAHRGLIVHRDLKPSNILVANDGNVKLLDFGIAKLLDVESLRGDATQTGQRRLTPSYAAPEQWEGGQVTIATDVYALGVLLHELLTGHKPSQVAKAERTAMSSPAGATRISRLPDESGRSLRGDLDNIVQKAIAPEPLQRYASVGALIDDIERHLEGKPVRAHSPSPWYRAKKFVTRHRIGVIAAALIAVAFLGLLGLAVWQAQIARLQTDLARLERDDAQREAQRSDAVRSYLTHMLRAAIEQSGPETPTVKAVFDKEAERVLKEYREQPKVAGQVVLELAELYSTMHDTAAAKPLLENFLQLPETDVDPQDRAAARQLLAETEIASGNLKRAQELLDRAFAFWQTAPEQFRRRRLEGLHDRGELQRAMGDLDGSIATLHEAIQLGGDLLGRNDREMGTLYNSMAITLTAAQRPAEALEAFRQAIEVFAAIGQAQSLDSFQITANAATLALQQGQLGEAERLFDQAIEPRRKLYGESAGLAATVGTYGRLLIVTDRARQAVPLLQDALAMSIKFIGEGTPPAVQARVYLGEAQIETGELHGARENLQIGRNTANAKLGSVNLLTSRAEVALAELAIAEGNPQQAIAALPNVIDTLRKLGPRAAPSLSLALLILGSAHLKHDEADAALAPLREAVAIRQKLLPEENWEVAEARERLGEALSNIGDPQAEVLLSASVSTLRMQLGQAHPLLQRAQLALAQQNR